MEENVFWLRLWQSVFGFLLILAAILDTCALMATRAYIHNGYIQTLVPGQTGTTWIKEK